MTQQKYTDGSGVAEIWANIKNYVTAQLLGKSNTGHTHTVSDVTDFPTLATVATSGSYNDLSNKPTIPTVNNATLTIQKNGSNVATFTSNASSNVTANISVPTKTSELTNNSGFLTSHQSLSSRVPVAGGAVMTGLDISRNVNNSSFGISGGMGLGYGGTIGAYGKDAPNRAGFVQINCYDGVNSSEVLISPSGSFTFNYNNTLKNVAMYEDVIPRSGGAVVTGPLFRNVNDNALNLGGGTSFNTGADIWLFGNAVSGQEGVVQIMPFDGTLAKSMWLRPDGTWTWDGTAVQITSDQRLKQQINKIDTALLDAWEDVELVQFKYNDAVNEKGDNARLHTGYVVQQIDEACQKHNIDISEYGLYCHEEYPERTEEVEVEQADGTKTKETKVIREASEHYSLRYTEVYAVECMYLRRCIARLTARIEELEKGNNTK